MRIRVWASRACLISAASLTALALVAPPIRADVAARPPTFEATGFASAIQASINTDPQTFVADLVRMDLPHGQSAFGADGLARSRAASIFPGVGAAEGPSLGWGQACGQGFPCEEFFPDGGFPPPYPLSAEAENPTVTEARPTVKGQQVGEPGDPVSFTLADVVATATDDEATTTAVGVSDAANPSTVHVGRLSAITKLRIEGGVVVAEAESRLSEVSLFGGVVQIDQIVARSVSKADGDRILTNAPQVTIGGATVGGQPVSITDRGIVNKDGPQDQGLLPTLGEGVERIFGAGPVSVRLIDTESDTREGTARGDAVGVLVHFEVNASGFPSGTTVIGDLILGTASTLGFADQDSFSDEDLSFDDEFFFEDDFNVIDDLGEFEDAEEEFGDDFAAVLGEQASFDGQELAVPAALSGTANEGRTLTRFEPLETLLRGVAADRIKFLYLAWTLALVGLALGSRLRPFRVSSHR
ncbi:MAG: hypothetical protein HYU28_08120 [Actinobacteria bacterium]|nr:hypothetical protein [Actinomycetota bacterium]